MNLTYTRPSLEQTFGLVPKFPGFRQYTDVVRAHVGAASPRGPCTDCPDQPLIRAHANSACEALVSMIPELAEIHNRNRSAGMMRYGDPECPILKGAIAGYMRAPTENIVVTNSTLQALERLPAVTNCKSVVCLYGDFAGYARASQLHRLPLTVVGAQHGRNADLHEQLALAVRSADRPLVPLTVGLTNPLMTRIATARAIEWISEANPYAVIVLDTAYAAYGDMDQAYYARLALQNRNVITLVPASKVLLHAGLAAGWMVVGDEALRARVRSQALPYPMPGFATAMLPDLLQADHVIAQMRALMMKAGDVLVSKLSALGLRDQMIVDKAPWLLVDAGESAGTIAAKLAEEGILIQRQSGAGPSLPRNWLRISYTEPGEAERIGRAYARAL